MTSPAPCRRHRCRRPDRLQPAVPHRVRGDARPRPAGHPAAARDHAGAQGARRRRDGARRLRLPAARRHRAAPTTPTSRSATPTSRCSSARCRARRGWSAAICSAPTAASSQPQGKALSDGAKRDVKILVVGNPANTNALIAQSNNARPRSRALHRHDAPRPQPGDRRSSATKLGVAGHRRSRQMTIWGNHSTTQYPDLFHCRGRGQERLRARRRPRVGRRHVHPDGRQARCSDHRGPWRVVGGIGGQRRDRPHALVGARARRRATGSRWPSRPTAATACRRDSSRRSPAPARTASTRSSRGSRSTTTVRAKIDASAAELAEERDAVRELDLI